LYFIPLINIWSCLLLHSLTSFFS
jgi:hypothetical protein